MTKATVGLAVVLALGCRSRPQSVVPASLPVDWQPYRWVTLDIGRETVRRAALVVETHDPALIRGSGGDSAATRMQLDFGFAGTERFGIPLRTLVPSAPAADSLRVLHGRITGLGIRDDSIGVTKSYPLGTVGLLFYGIKGLIIDQVEHRIGAPRTGARLPPELTDRMQWTQATEEVGRLAVPLVWQGDRLGRLWYDPGSSLVPLLLDGPTWRLVTGRQGGEPDNQRLVFPAGGDSLVLIGAPTTEPLVLGGIGLGRVTAWRVLANPAGLGADRFDDGVVGQVGNQLFERFRMLYVNVRAKQLGVIP
ncbi:MAG: hypothetical protein AB7L66_01730 [Gemmatimonadales bacterium]